MRRLWRLSRVRPLWWVRRLRWVRRLWRLLDLRGLRRLLGVCRMRSGLVGRRSAAACAFLSAGAGRAAIDAVKAAAQGRGKAFRNAVHQIGATAECGGQHAGPIARSTGDASAADHTRAAAFASCDHARIDLGLIDTER